jgi:hypothetical protein
MLRGWGLKVPGLLWEKDDGLLRHGQDIACGAVSRMAQAYKHVQAFHLAHNIAAEGGEPLVLVLATSTHAVVAVVGQQHPSHPQGPVGLQQADLVADGVGAFDVEGHRKSACLHRQDYITCSLDHHIILGAVKQPSPHAGQRSEVIFDAMITEADIQRHGVNTCIPVALELRKKGCVIRSGNGHANVVVPDHGSIDQGARLLQRFVRH